VLLLLLHLLEGKLVQGAVEQQHFLTLLQKLGDDRVVLHGCLVVTRDLIDVGLPALETFDLVLERDGLFALGGLEAQQLQQLGTIGGVVDHALLDVVAEVLIEVHVHVGHVVETLLGLLLLFVLLVFRLLLIQRSFLLLLVCEFGQPVDHLACGLLADDLHGLVLVDGLSAHIKGQVVGVDDSACEFVHPERQQLVELVSDQHTLDL